MKDKIKIISISNHHQWDGRTVSRKDFDTIVKALELSKFEFVINYVNENNTRFIYNDNLK